ncbi:unnamed protein product, partial [Amoebophrya sp. A25]
REREDAKAWVPLFKSLLSGNSNYIYVIWTTSSSTILETLTCLRQIYIFWLFGPCFWRFGELLRMR